jgi:hypothetical protein
VTGGPVHRALPIPLTVRQNGRGGLELAPDYAASRAIAARIEARERMMAAARRPWWTRLAEWLKR